MDNDSGTPLPSGPVHGPSQAPPRLSPARPAVVHGATCVSSRGWKIVAVAAGDSAGGGRLLPGESRTLVLRFRRAQGRAAPGPGESLEAAVDRSRVALASSGATSQLAAVGSATDSVLWCAARCTDARPASWALNLSPFPTTLPPHPPTPCTPPSLGGGLSALVPHRAGGKWQCRPSRRHPRVPSASRQRPCHSEIPSGMGRISSSNGRCRLPRTRARRCLRRRAACTCVPSRLGRPPPSSICPRPRRMAPRHPRHLTAARRDSCPPAAPPVAVAGGCRWRACPVCSNDAYVRPSWGLLRWPTPLAPRRQE